MSFVDDFSIKNVSFFKMLTQEKGSLQANQKHIFESRILYDIQGVPFVLKEVYLDSKLIYKESDIEELEDLLRLEVHCDDEKKQINLFGDVGFVNNDNSFELGGLNFSLSYGSRYINLPFYLRLDKFILTIGH